MFQKERFDKAWNCESFEEEFVPLDGAFGKFEFVSRNSRENIS